MMADAPSHPPHAPRVEDLMKLPRWAAAAFAARCARRVQPLYAAIAAARPDHIAAIDAAIALGERCAANAEEASNEGAVAADLSAASAAGAVYAAALAGT